MPFDLAVPWNRYGTEAGQHTAEGFPELTPERGGGVNYNQAKVVCYTTSLTKRAE